MRDILGHRSWNREEVYAFFDKGSFTMCSLPHYRYDREKQICGQLRRCGLIVKTGKTDTCINYKSTLLYHVWRAQVKAGFENGDLNKLYKKLRRK